MTWSVSAKVNAGNASEVLLDLRETALQQNPNCQEQFDAVAEAVDHIIQIGVLGGQEKDYLVVVSGHCNENHQAQGGVATDYISIQITQQ